MTSRALLFCCGLLSVTAPLVARAAPIEAISASLQSRLRAQLLELAPQLSGNGTHPDADDSLALPLAQLGDLAAANRLASTPFTRDGIAQWRVEQRALRGDWSGASALAASVDYAPVRADCFLVIARLAADKRDFAAARAALLLAMNALDKAPDATQLAYAGWLWSRIGDRAASRRVLLDKAYPTAKRQDVQEQQEWEKLTGKPRNSRFVFSKKSNVVSFAARSGSIKELVESSGDAEIISNAQWFVSHLQTPGDLQFLYEQLLALPEVAPTTLYSFALRLASLGRTQQALQLRERARTMPDENPPFSAYLELLLAAELNDEATQTAIEQRWPTVLDQAEGDKRAPDELRLWPQITRLFRFDFSDNLSDRLQLRADATPDAVASYTAQLLQQPLDLGDATLPALFNHYARRDDEQLRLLTAAMVEAIEARSDQTSALRASGQSSSWNTSLATIAALLRRTNHPAQAQALTDALVQFTPANFRPLQAQALMEAGLDGAARQSFDPAEHLRNNRELRARIDATTDPQKKLALQRQVNSFDWSGYAETEARYRAPDAPARWFAAVEEPRQRAEVLRGWIDGLSPQLKLAPPYTRTKISRDNGITTGGSY